MLRRALPAVRAVRAARDATIPDILPGLAITLSGMNLLRFIGALAALMIFVGFQFTLHLSRAQAWQLPLIWALYLLGVAAIAALRQATNRYLVIAAEAVGLGAAVALNFTAAEAMGAIMLEALALVVIFRYPRRWLIPLLSINAGAFVALQALHDLVLTHGPNALVNFGLTIFFLILLAWIPFSIRARAQVILRLQRTQQQLEAEVARTAELAAARERARIARDIHDVLAHSLTVLSIQAQAARQIVTQQPERAAAMLDDIAAVLRESLSESRRVVGLLREAGAAGHDESPLGARLEALAERFGERTGIRCAFHESGMPQPTVPEADDTLTFALQEALTNAFRHGGARHVWADLAWTADAATLTVRDDGAGASAGPSVGGGNGLRGMRERAAGLGGTMSAGPHAESGFVVRLALPLLSKEPA
jgi:signal transduction histidine kinase